MSSRRAAGGPSGAVALVAVAALAVGCSGDVPAKRVQDAPATHACRQQWAALEGELARRAGQHDLSAQAPRWDSLAAGAQYFTTRARPSDCTTTLAREHDRAEALSAYTNRLRAYDMPHQLVAATPDVLHYLRLPLPKPHRVRVEAGNGGTRMRTVRPPSKREVRAALESLRRAAPRAMADLHPAWQQAAAVDIGDPAQVRQAVAGLRLLAHDSSAFATCVEALRTLRSAARFASPREPRRR